MFRPEYKEFKEFPYIDYNATSTTSPFDTWYKNNINKERLQQNNFRFCELCSTTYANLRHHLQSREHRRNALDASLYQGVDNLIKKGKSVEEFMEEVQSNYTAR